MTNLTLRWEEFQYYDPIDDVEVVRLMGISSLGTWYAVTPIYPGKQLRERRKNFREYVIGELESGNQPCELEF